MQFEVIDSGVLHGTPTRIVLRPRDVHPETLAELLRLFKRDFSELTVSHEGDTLVFTGDPLSTEMLPRACLRFAHGIEGQMQLVGWVFTTPSNQTRPKHANLLRPKDLVLSIVPVGSKTPEQLFAQLKEELKDEELAQVELTQIGVIRLNLTYLNERQMPTILRRRSPQLLAALELGGYL